MAQIKIKEIAERQGFNISSLARQADVDRSVVQNMWEGRGKKVELEKLTRIAAVLGVHPGVLIVDESGKGARP